MQTVERVEQTSGAEVRSHRPWRAVAVVAVVALALGFVGGWLANRDSDSGSSDSGVEQPRAVLVGGGALTDRQQQMVGVLDQYMEAWRNGDGQTVASFHTPNGEFVIASTDETTVYSVADGSLANYISRGQWTGKVLLTPMLVDGDHVTLFYSFMGRRAAVVDFTSSGDVRIIRTMVLT